MINTNTAKRFKLSWTKFNSNLVNLTERKFKLSEKNPYSPYSGLLNEVIQDIVSNKGVNAIVDAVFILPQTDTKYIKYLIQEMDIYNEIVQGENQNAFNVRKIDTGLEAGKTIKDSIEKLIKLPSWLKKSLNIVNELLSIIKGA